MHVVTAGSPRWPDAREGRGRQAAIMALTTCEGTASGPLPSDAVARVGER